MIKTNLNNYSLYSNANVLDSVKVAYHKLCNPCFSDFDLGCPPRQAIIISPESRALEPLGVLDLRGLFFTSRRLSIWHIISEA